MENTASRFFSLLSGQCKCRGAARALSRPCRRFSIALPVFLLWLLMLGGCGLKGFGPESPSNAPAARKVVESAYSQLGVRYVSGGTSPQRGFDCSGLVQWAYGRNGIQVPRLTRDQAKAGALVRPDAALHPADIVVFRNTRAPNGLHTGIYTGDGHFIHSPGKGQRVRIESLDVAYWKNSYLGARRLVK